MLVKCVTSCTDANDNPDFDFCIVDCSPSEYHCGEHYDKAKLHAENMGFEPCIVYDENDMKWLIEHFVWQTADIVK